MEVAQPVARRLPRDAEALYQVILIVQSVNEALRHQELCGKLVRLRLGQTEGRGAVPLRARASGMLVCIAQWPNSWAVVNRARPSPAQTPS